MQGKPPGDLDQAALGPEVNPRIAKPAGICNR